MVVSQFNDKISYTESKSIDESDKGRKVNMYKIKLFKTPVVIALGDIKYDHAKDDILYVPVYLVIDKLSKIFKIGIYELKYSEYEHVLDNDNDIDIAVLDGPNLFSYVTKQYILDKMKNMKLIKDEEDGEKDEEEIELDDSEFDDEDLDKTIH